MILSKNACVDDAGVDRVRFKGRNSSSSIRGVGPPLNCGAAGEKVGAKLRKVGELPPRRTSAAVSPAFYLAPAS